MKTLKFGEENGQNGCLCLLNDGQIKMLPSIRFFLTINLKMTIHLYYKVHISFHKLLFLFQLLSMKFRSANWMAMSGLNLQEQNHFCVDLKALVEYFFYDFVKQNFYETIYFLLSYIILIYDVVWPKKSHHCRNETVKKWCSAPLANYMLASSNENN